MSLPVLVLAISLIALVAPSSAAQSTGPSLADLMPDEFRIDAIVEESHGRSVVVRGRLVAPDGKIVSRQLITCDKGNSQGAWLAVQDHVARTDDRWGVDASFCDVFRAAVQQRHGRREP
jgi:hypothetical protein